MSAPSDIVARVRERALQERGELPARVGEWEVAAVERELGFPLPRLLVRLYQEVANGGFGPAYLLLPLVGEGRTAVAEYGPCEYWPHGVLPILDWGCGMYAAVDCLDPTLRSCSSSRTPAPKTGRRRGSPTRLHSHSG